MPDRYSTAGLPDWLSNPPIGDYLARMFSAIDRAERAADEAVIARDELIEQLKGLQQPIAASGQFPREVMNQQQTAEFAACSVRLIQRAMQDGSLHASYVLGKSSPRYLRSNVLAWLAGRDAKASESDESKPRLVG